MTAERKDATKLSAEDEKRVAEAREAMAELIARVPRKGGYALEPAVTFRAGEKR